MLARSRHEISAKYYSYKLGGKLFPMKKCGIFRVARKLITEAIIVLTHTLSAVRLV
jgi:hypothetical protein